MEEITQKLRGKFTTPECQYVFFVEGRSNVSMLPFVKKPIEHVAIEQSRSTINRNSRLRSELDICMFWPEWSGTDLAKAILRSTKLIYLVPQDQLNAYQGLRIHTWISIRIPDVQAVT
jgi:hypothetical protein